MTVTKVNATFLSKLKRTVLNKSGSLPDLTGKTLGEFQSVRRMDISSGEAEVYLCSGTGSHEGERFVLKYYRREDALKPEVLEKLSGIRNPVLLLWPGMANMKGISIP